MFVTFPEFKLPVQLQGDDAAIWRGVELMLRVPWLLASFDLGAGARRTFFVDSPDLVVQIVRSDGFRSLKELALVLPPKFSRSKNWDLVEVVRIECELRSFDGATPGLVLLSSDGRRFEGHAMTPSQRDPSDLSTVIEIKKA